MVITETLLENAAGPSLTGSDVLFEDQTLTKEVKTIQSPLNPDTPQFVARQPAQFLPATTCEFMNSTNVLDKQPPALLAGHGIHFQWTDRMGDNISGDALRKPVKSLAEQVNTSRLPPPKPSVFSGDPMRYPSWKIAFQTLIEHRTIPAWERLHYLKKYIRGHVKDTVESYLLLPPEDALDERYGNQVIIADAFRDKLENWQRINSRDGNALQNYADFLGQCNTAIKSIGSLRVLNDEHAVRSTEKYVEKKTVTTTMGQKRTVKGSHQELMVLAVTDIVNQLIQAHIQKKDVNLNSIKGKSASKYGLVSQPRLMDIIAAVPQQYKKALVPKLKAKPVRTASCIAVVPVMCKPHCCPHIAMTENICVYLLGAKIPISNILYNHTPVMSQHQCEQFEPGTILTYRPGTELNS